MSQSKGRWWAQPTLRYWIPAYAGMTERGVRLRRTGVRGVPDIPPFSSPKIEDPPQEEWGTKGVDRSLHTAMTQKRVVARILIRGAE